MEKRDLFQRLEDDAIICAEGYLFELERRGYLQAGAFVPEVALDHPEVLEEVHREFLHAGSDVVEAFTYNGHRDKMRIIGKEDLLEPLNRQALRIAKKVADANTPEPALVAGNICNTNIFDPSDESSKRQVRKMFDEMVNWAAEEGVDYVIGETFYFYEEAEIALEVIKHYNFPAVITFALMEEGVLNDGYQVEEACQRLKDKGAAVVGMNCFRGPQTITPFLRKIRDNISGPIAALPVPYRTTETHPTFFNIPDTQCPCEIPLKTTFPIALEPFYCNRFEIFEWAKTMYHELNINYLGICCGAAPIHIRAIAEAIGREVPASRYTADMSKHFIFGDEPQYKKAGA